MCEYGTDKHPNSSGLEYDRPTMGERRNRLVLDSQLQKMDKDDKVSDEIL
jgi:hypothetical protein